MSTVFSFGERVAGYDVNVLNEREVRASAGILFFLALIAFMNAWLTGNFQPTRIFVVAFLIDFAIRVLINPRYSPSLMLGRFAVRNQVPEYVGATQKRFAWSIGLALALAMLFLVVVNRVVGPANLVICSACLLLLFFEAAFGICIACTIYNVFHRQKARLCPGGRCEISARHEIQKISPAQTAVFVLFLGVMAAVAQSIGSETPVSAMQAVSTPAGGKDCTPPDWAVSIGHAEMWKLHNNCN